MAEKRSLYMVMTGYGTEDDPGEFIEWHHIAASSQRKAKALARSLGCGHCVGCEKIHPDEPLNFYSHDIDEDWEQDSGEIVKPAREWVAYRQGDPVVIASTEQECIGATLEGSASKEAPRAE